jgi:hypothetical protein
MIVSSPISIIAIIFPFTDRHLLALSTSFCHFSIGITAALAFTSTIASITHALCDSPRGVRSGLLPLLQLSNDVQLYHPGNYIYNAPLEITDYL